MEACIADWEPGDPIWDQPAHVYREGFYQIYDDNDGLASLADSSTKDDINLCFFFWDNRAKGLLCSSPALPGSTRCIKHPYSEYDSPSMISNI